MPPDRAHQPASSQAGDWHDVTGHHRYYGSSAINGGERIVEDRRRAHRQSLRFLIGSLTPTKKRGGMAPAALQLLNSLVQA